MALQRTIRNIFLILFVIVIKCQTSTTRADDDDDDNYPNNDDSSELDSSEEYIEPVTRQSASSSFFSTVATMRAMPRPPRGNSNRNDFINETLCASNGEFYPNLKEILAANEMLMFHSFCETGCGKPQPNPCPKRGPVCAEEEGNYLVYENECELNKTRCERLESGQQPINPADPASCQLESCGTPQPNPCPKRVPVCAGYEENYAVYEDECQVNKVRCERRGSGLKPINTTQIGRCQVEVNATQLTCHEILRGKCPLETTGQQVCNVTGMNTFKNICRALHKRCKKQDDTCYHVKVPCGSYNGRIHGRKPPIQDCSRFIRHSFPLVNPSRPCYEMSTSRKTLRNCKCSKAPFPAPDIPELPPFLHV